jgi:hypothetical protein
MNKNEAKEIISSTFSSDFNEQRYEKFVSNLFKTYDPEDKIVEGQYIKLAYKAFVIKYKITGTFEDREGHKIDILEVNLNKASTLERARTAQRNFVAEYLKSRNKDVALVAFVSPDNKEWRLSLVKLENSLEVIDEKLKTKEEITPAKRWSFLVGENEGSHTAQSRFVNIIVSDEDPNLAELESAFDIETVTKEFFHKYTELYFQLKDHLDTLMVKDEVIKKDFEGKEISTVDFAKKTLGQIVFLYFLQKKGWFGVAPDKEWGEGPKRFLRDLFTRKEKYGTNFFNDILEPLFYEALAQDRGTESIYPRLNNCRMPFLNGGLFEPMNGYLWETTDIIIPDELFSNDHTTKEGEKGDGILDVFDRYNFTVNENEPLEKEVAVDPEMLGKVFENLLDIKDRKSKGAFYTPREIVHYMCQESLINYLHAETNNEIPRSDLELFIQKGDRIIENDKIALERQEERIKKYGNDKYKDSTYSLLLPISVRTMAEKLDELLKNIKVADPAVGSGAFPLGMINEIVRARKVLNVYLKSNISDYEFKKHTITHSIYGVDIDPGAVDIAKLRLWLALVVDEETPHPLPNLEHKIMQGNSLISEYEGIRLFDDSFLEDSNQQEKENNEINNKLSLLQREYFSLHAKDELTLVKKTEIEKKIKVLQNRLKNINKEKETPSTSIGLFDIPDQHKKAQEKTILLQKKVKEFINKSQRSEKQKLKEEIDTLKWELIEETLKEQGKEDKLEEIKRLRRKNIRPFFIWKLEFSDVFREKGGFDVVIGNPPYLPIQKIKESHGFNDANYVTYSKSSDLYCLFYEQGVNLIKKNGILSYITSNSWMRTKYGKRLRNYFQEKTNPLILINFEDSQVFESAIVESNILILKKSSFQKKLEAVNIDKAFNGNGSLSNYFLANKISISNLNDEGWIIANEELVNLKNKVEKGNKTIKELGYYIVRGFTTGCNNAFYIDKSTKDTIESIDEKSKDIIKPILRGRDLTRWKASFANTYALVMIKGINISNYPAVEDYLKQYYKELCKKSGSAKWYELQANPSPQILNSFQEEKIVWGELSDKAKFVYEPDGYYLDATVFLMTGKNIKYVLAVLNSKLGQWYFEQISTSSGMGTNRWKKYKIETFPLKENSRHDQAIINLVNDIIEITFTSEYDPKNPPVKQKELEKQIDQLVYKLYDLTEEEIGIIEDSAKK